MPPPALTNASVRKGLCAAPADWPYSIAFTRDGEEIPAGSRAARDRDDEKGTV